MMIQDILSDGKRVMSNVYSFRSDKCARVLWRSQEQDEDLTIARFAPSIQTPGIAETLPPIRGSCRNPFASEAANPDTS